MKKMWFAGLKPVMMAAICLCAMGATAQEKLALTLEQAIEIALSDNPTIQVAEQTVQLKKISNRRR